MANPDNGLARQAVHELVAKEWITDGSLEGKYFVGAGLYNAMLLHAKLRGTVFTGADLSNASFQYADLEKAELSVANLREATLWNANLRNTRFIGTDLRVANLGGADLHGAYMIEVCLQGAIFMYEIALSENFVVILDETTVLPDRSRYDPNNGLDQLERFTNREHPNFWESRLPECT